MGANNDIKCKRCIIYKVTNMFTELQLGCSVISPCLQSCKWQVISASLTFLTTIDTYGMSTLKEKNTRVAKFDKLSKSSC
jgi:hypothetical protein